MKLRWNDSRAVSGGIAAIETAACLSAVAVLLVAIVDIGRLGRVGDALTSAARRGAVCASENGAAAADLAAIRSAALRDFGLRNVTGANPAVSASISTGSGAMFVSVTVTYELADASPLNLFKIPSMSRTVTLPMLSE
jgi:hypothetical protein